MLQVKLSKKFPSYDNKPASITIDNKDFAREQISNRFFKKYFQKSS